MYAADINWRQHFQEKNIDKVSIKTRIGSLEVYLPLKSIHLLIVTVFDEENLCLYSYSSLN